jgi:hypothetical protein
VLADTIYLRKDNAMNAFLQRQASAVMGHLAGWDRLRFRGTLRMLANVVGLFRFLCYRGQQLKSFGDYAQVLSQQVRAASLLTAEQTGRPIIHLNSPGISKEDQARQIATRDDIRQGLIGVLTAVEPCWSYNIQSNRKTGHLELVHQHRKCQHLYHYMIHPVFGFMHMRLQTWLPFNFSVCINGREWLGRQMDAAGIAYRRVDNCFTHVADVERAQALMDQQIHFDYAATLGQLAQTINPARQSIVGEYNIPYYWSLDESEWADDVMFNSPGRLQALYPSLTRHAIESFGSPSVLRFLGRSVPASGRVNGNFAGEVLSEYKHRPEGVCVKHRINRNSIKMYDKAASVLRVETTLNNMRDIKAPRQVKGKTVYRPMRKGVADMPRRAEVSQASNRRYLEALAAVATPMPLKTLTQDLGSPVKWKDKRVRGLNLLGAEDAALLAAAGRGEFLINGLRNRDLQGLLFAGTSDDPKEQRRRSGQVTRKIRMLRAHGLLHKVPHTHRYMVSEKGRKVIAALHAAREADIEKLSKAA